MNIGNTTSRRALLKAAPIAAAAVAVPGSVYVTRASEMPAWQEVKQAFFSSAKSVTAAMQAEEDAEKVVWAYGPAAPTQTFNYTAPALDRGWLRTDAYDTSVTLNRGNWSGWADTFADRPDFISFRKRMVAWQNDPAHQEAKQRLTAVRKDLGAAHDANLQAWRQMASFPASSPEIVADKIAASLDYVECDESAVWELIGFLHDDLKRITIAAGQA